MKRLTPSSTLRRPRSLESRPRRTLVLRTLRLSDFYDEIGQAAFGTAWTPGTLPKRPSTRRKTLPLLEQRATLVADDLSFALESGTIQAAILLDLPNIKASTKIKTPKNEQDPDDLLGNIGESDLTCTTAGKLPEHSRLTMYRIHTEFWSSAWLEVVDWQLSQLYIPVRFIEVILPPRCASERNLSQPLITYRSDLLFSSDQLLSGPITVLRADYALSEMFSLGEIPSTAVNERYMRFKNRLIDEVVAAGWRWLANNKRYDEEVRTGELESAMVAYLDQQGFDDADRHLGDKGVQAVARQVMNERRTRNCSSMVLKNTSLIRCSKANPKA